jgi:hypothetical protein
VLQPAIFGDAAGIGEDDDVSMCRPDADITLVRNGSPNAKWLLVRQPRNSAFVMFSNLIESAL